MEKDSEYYKDWINQYDFDMKLMRLIVLASITNALFTIMLFLFWK